MAYRRYEHVDKAKLKAIRAGLRKAGLHLEGKNPWRLLSPEHGVEFAASWYEDSEVLLLELIKKPFLIPEARIWSEITRRINSL
jgi:hypothetical protein